MPDVCVSREREMHVYLCMYTYMCMHRCMYTHVCMYICMFVCDLTTGLGWQDAALAKQQTRA
jgi:hypothetical protein